MLIIRKIKLELLHLQIKNNLTMLFRTVSNSVKKYKFFIFDMCYFVFLHTNDKVLLLLNDWQENFNGVVRFFSYGFPATAPVHQFIISF